MLQIKHKKNSKIESQKKYYLQWSKLFSILACIYTIWVIIVIIGIYYLNLGYRWSVLTIEHWILGGIILIGVFIFIELFFILTGYKDVKAQKQQHLLYKGNQLYIFTYPLNIKGGIFSRTYIRLNENTIIRVRTQMIKPEDLWKQKQP